MCFQVDACALTQLVVAVDIQNGMHASGTSTIILADFEPERGGEDEFSAQPINGARESPLEGLVGAVLGKIAAHHQPKAQAEPVGIGPIQPSLPAYFLVALVGRVSVFQNIISAV